MKTNKGYIILGLIIAFTLFFELAAHADVQDQTTTMTFSQPIQVPGQILPAGTYLFRLANPDFGQDIVRIYNSDGTSLIATLQTIPTERREPTGDVAVTLAEQGAGKPDVLLTWFYPGLETGHEFVYSKEKEKELAQDRQQTIVGNQPTTSNSIADGAGN
jgi:hypothetical protein